MQTITQESLSQFYGSECLFFSKMFPKFRFTEGVHYLNENGVGWLITDIFSLQSVHNVKEQEFQTWDLTVNGDGTATLVCSDGNGNDVHKQTLQYTDFPLPSMRLFFVNNVLMLPSEY